MLGNPLNTRGRSRPFASAIQARSDSTPCENPIRKSLTPRKWLTSAITPGGLRWAAAASITQVLGTFALLVNTARPATLAGSGGTRACSAWDVRAEPDET